MYFDNMFDNRQPPIPSPLRKPTAPSPGKANKAAEAAKRKTTKKTTTKCPSGFYFDKKKGRCVQAGVGPEFKP